MKLDVLTLEQCERVRIWRNAEMEVWRTPYMLTVDMQEGFYKRCSDRNSPHRYWAIVDDNSDKISYTELIGMVGITYIQWENSIGEITLIINPKYRKMNLGRRAVDLLLNEAFNHLNLQTVFGECYTCNESYNFWRKITEKYFNDAAKTICTTLPCRKYWQGKYYSSLYFSIDKDDFNAKYNRNK